MKNRRFVRTDSLPWCNTEVYPGGSHRMQPSWLSDRYNWLDEEGMPMPIPKETFEQLLSTHVDQTYVCDEAVS